MNHVKQGNRTFESTDKLSTMAVNHIPVLLHEVVELLAPEPGDLILDCTIGGGGHAEALLGKAQPGGKLIGIDHDQSALQAAATRLQPYKDKITLIQGSFADIGIHMDQDSFKEARIVLADIGISSMQIDNPDRGFSYLHPKSPLDMRMNNVSQAVKKVSPKNINILDDLEGLTAAQILNYSSLDILQKVFEKYGEFRKSKTLAEAIVQYRKTKPYVQSSDLVQTVHAVILPNRHNKHPEATVFQALRIAVNGELTALQKLLNILVSKLSSGAKIGIISFHSLEDRIVKNFFRDAAKKCKCPLEQIVCTCNGRSATLRLVTRHPVKATDEEIQNNPRSRSAILRVAQII